MVNYNIEVSDTFRGIPCIYCNRVATLTMDYDGEWKWICHHHRKVLQEGWLELVILVEEATSG